MFEYIAQDIDFRIDHFGDETDVSWQSAKTQDVFPKGTESLGIDTQNLGAGWHLTCFNQRFFYGVRQREVTSLTYITSHETDGKVDFFRETVTNIVNV